MRTRSRKRKFLLIVTALVSLIAGGLWSLYLAARHVPTFYAETLEQPEKTARTASHQMRRQVTTLASDTTRAGSWGETFTAEQINGWLAVDFLEKHPSVLPEGVSHPRISITANEARIGCTFNEPWPNTVYSIVIQPYIAEPNVVAIRFLKARAGMLPMPLGEVIDEISDGAAERGLRLQWQQIDGDPVLLMPLDQVADNHDERYVLEQIQLAEGAIHFGGHTKSKQEMRQQRDALPTAQSADSSGDQTSRQR